MTSDEIKKAREIIDAATEGPWEVRTCGSLYTVATKHAFVMENDTEKDDMGDAQFIAAARTGWPKALTEIERLQKLYANAWQLRDVYQTNAAELREERDQLRAEVERLEQLVRAWRFAAKHSEARLNTQGESVAEWYATARKLEEK